MNISHRLTMAQGNIMSVFANFFPLLSFQFVSSKIKVEILKMEKVQKIFSNFKNSDLNCFGSFSSTLRNFFSSPRNLPADHQNNLILFDDFFICEKIFGFCGFAFLRHFENSSDKRRKFFFFILLSFLIFFMFHSAISFVIFIGDSKKFLQAVESLAYAGMVTIGCFKIFFVMFKNREKTLKVIEKLDKNFPHHNFEQEVFDVRRHLKKLKINSSFLFLVYSLVALMPLTNPLQHLIHSWLTSEKIKTEFVLEIWYPFEASSLIGLWMSYLEIFSILVLMVLIITSTDLLYASIMTITSLEFDILAMKIRKVENAEDLKNLIKIHQELTEIAGELEGIFSPLLFINIMIVVNMICATAFLIFVRKKNLKSYKILFKV